MLQWLIQCFLDEKFPDTKLSQIKYKILEILLNFLYVGVKFFHI